MKKHHVLIIGHVWPEPDSTAAGKRMLQLIDVFLAQQWEVSFTTAAQKSDYTTSLKKMGVSEFTCELNASSFQKLCKKISPNIVVYDRYLTEEQFGWRVRESVPNAVQILDTEDLHFLRKAREEAFKRDGNLANINLYSEHAKREIGAMMRCDLNLIISEVEAALLINKFQFSEEQLFYLPFLLDINIECETPSYLKRKHVMTIGNFLHAPNWDQVLLLKTKIWPLIRKQNKGIELHVYGAYPSEKVHQLHQPKEGFIIKGRAKDALATIQEYRLLLAPLRFGAGLKGKIIDALLTNTPVVTTPIGAEGIEGKINWPGAISTDDNTFALNVSKLYSDQKKWENASKLCPLLLTKKFNKNRFESTFVEKIEYLIADLVAHRNKFFIGQVLSQHQVNAQKFMSLWIEAKTKFGKK